ncbi:hypothetical protein CPB85DRAFT_1538071 [Mucidula mucida]|nr:hypothetical protein CPB85DRAFT_1538071 [Mucidula mucida]
MIMKLSIMPAMFLALVIFAVLGAAAPVKVDPEVESDGDGAGSVSGKELKQLLHARRLRLCVSDRERRVFFPVTAVTHSDSMPPIFGYLVFAFPVLCALLATRGYDDHATALLACVVGGIFPLPLRVFDWALPFGGARDAANDVWRP